MKSNLQRKIVAKEGQFNGNSIRQKTTPHENGFWLNNTESRKKVLTSRNPGARQNIRGTWGNLTVSYNRFPFLFLKVDSRADRAKNRGIVKLRNCIKTSARRWEGRRVSFYKGPLFPLQGIPSSSHLISTSIKERSVWAEAVFQVALHQKLNYKYSTVTPLGQCRSYRIQFCKSLYRLKQQQWKEATKSSIDLLESRAGRCLFPIGLRIFQNSTHWCEKQFSPLLDFSWVVFDSPCIAQAIWSAYWVENSRSWIQIEIHWTGHNRGSRVVFHGISSFMDASELGRSSAVFKKNIDTS